MNSALLNGENSENDWKVFQHIQIDFLGSRRVPTEWWKQLFPQREGVVYLHQGAARNSRKMPFFNKYFYFSKTRLTIFLQICRSVEGDLNMIFCIVGVLARLKLSRKMVENERIYFLYRKWGVPFSWKLVGMEGRKMASTNIYFRIWQRMMRENALEHDRN